jgi:hypothetical protein
VNTLRELETLHAEFGEGRAPRKRRCLEILARTELRSADSLARLHELALFLCACPDSPGVLAAARALLARFSRRADLRRFRAALADSGIEGTPIRFQFFLPTAARLGRAFPGALAIDWEAWDGAQHERLEALLPLLVRAAEAPALDAGLGARAWLERARARGEGEGAFLARRFSELEAAPDVRAALWDGLDPWLRLDRSAGGPARTRARADWLPVHFQEGPLARERPELSAAARAGPLAVRRLRGARARELVALARDAMVARARDLDAFMHADERDVRLVDCGGGLCFVMLGVVPAQRLPLETVQAFLTLRNGVPIGYVLASAFLGSCEVAYNVFETWRGAEAAQVYGRVLGMLHALYGADSFCIDPYQLGHENEEGIASGAWWFYQKLGFRPDAPAVRARMRRELARGPGARSTPATLRLLASAPLFWSAGRARADVLGRFPLARLGEAALGALARHGGEAGCARAALARLRLRAIPARGAEERQAFERWAPLLCALPGVERWSASERAALARVACRKGAVDELEYVRALQAQRKLRRALCALARVRSSV